MTPEECPIMERHGIYSAEKAKYGIAIVFGSCTGSESAIIPAT